MGPENTITITVKSNKQKVVILLTSPLIDLHLQLPFVEHGKQRRSRLQAKR